MLRAISLALRIMAGLFAFLSPLTLIHWTCQAANLPLLESYFSWLDPLLVPLTYSMSQMWTFPAIAFRGQSLSIAQGVLGLGFTALFFVLTVLSQWITLVDKKIALSLQTVQQRELFQKTSEKTIQQVKKKVPLTATKPLLLAYCDFLKNPKVLEVFEQYTQFQGVRLQATENMMLFTFPGGDNSLAYAIKAATGLLNYYNTCRPMDPQPPFYLMLHAVEAGAPQEALGLQKCWQMQQYTKPNHISVSYQMQRLWEESTQKGSFDVFSTGLYEFPPESVQELYQLEIPGWS